MELKFIHQEVIEEENLNVNDLPQEVKQKIKGFNLLYSKLKNNPDNEKLLNTVKRTSVAIADEIQNWLESDFDEEDDDNDNDNNPDNNSDKNTPPTPPAPKSTPTDVNKSKPNASNPATSNDNAPKKFGNLVMEKKILEVINSNGGRIDIKTLSQIIGREPSYPAQVVNNITLKKVFLSSAYKLA